MTWTAPAALSEERQERAGHSSPTATVSSGRRARPRGVVLLDRGRTLVEAPAQDQTPMRSTNEGTMDEPRVS